MVKTLNKQKKKVTNEDKRRFVEAVDEAFAPPPEKKKECICASSKEWKGGIAVDCPIHSPPPEKKKEVCKTFVEITCPESITGHFYQQNKCVFCSKSSNSEEITPPLEKKKEEDWDVWGNEVESDILLQEK